MAFLGLVGSLVSIPISTQAGFLYEWNPAAPFVSSLFIDAATFVFIVILMIEPEEREI